MERDDLYAQALFPETAFVLAALSSKYTLGIFSEGYKNYQKLKLIPKDISNFISKDHVYIFRNKTQPRNLKKLPNNSIIVDDKLEIVEKIASRSTHYPIWINRKNLEKHPKIQTIFNLQEIEKIIDSL